MRRLQRPAKYFKASEFKLGLPHPNLILLLDEVREALGTPVFITNSGRTIHDHIQIYIDLYKDEWLEKIPWKSRHLPCFKTNFLRAVDFKAEKSRNKNEVEYHSGETIKDTVLSIAKSYSHINVGIGVGQHFLHLDVDRTESYKVWYYDR